MIYIYSLPTYQIICSLIKKNIYFRFIFINVKIIKFEHLKGKNSLTISLSAVDTTYVGVALNENIINDNVHIYRGFLEGNLALIADPFLLFYGTIDEFKKADNTDNASLILTITSHWGNFSKISGRVTTDNSQQRFFSGDKGMEFSALTIKDIRWGRL